MNGKEFIIKLVISYFVLVTFITGAIFITGVTMDPDARFGYSAFASPLIYGILAVLPTIVMYSKTELSVKALLIRKAVQLILIESIFIYIIRCKVSTGTQDISMFWIGLSIFIIFILVHLIFWINNYLEAKKLTENLIKFQNSCNETSTHPSNH